LKTAYNDYVYLKKYTKIVQAYKDKIVNSSDIEVIPPNSHICAAQDPPVKLQFLSSESNNENMNHIPCQEADSTGSLTERSTHNDNDDNKDMTRREDHHNSFCHQERNGNFHENNKEVNKENIAVDKRDNCCTK
jgi:hypothetical protein